MGKFESYPSISSLNDSDITLYNHNTSTYKITFGTLANLIRNKIQSLGMVTSITAGAGLQGGTITSTGTLKCALKSEALSTLTATTPTTTTNRQYPVVLDAQGNLSVNVPWAGSAYSEGVGISISGFNEISVVFNDTYTSTSRTQAATANVVKQVYDNSLRKDGSNAYSLAIGTVTNTVQDPMGEYSVSIGESNNVSGDNALAQGFHTNAYGDCSHAEGRYTTASARSHAEGNCTYAGSISHSEGYGSNIINSGHNQLPSDFANEYDNTSITSIGFGSHAEGYTASFTNTSGNIQANGMGAHAEGYAGGDTDSCSAIIASGNGAHAEGYAVESEDCTLARGNGSHAEGCSTWAIGEGAHSEGKLTVANGNYSHAGGYGATASLVSQFVQGGYHRKFGNTTSYDRGLFGIQPDGNYYTVDYADNHIVYDGQNGLGGTIKSDINIRISLAPQSIYLLFIAPNGTSNNDYAHVLTIHTQVATGTPMISELRLTMTNATYPVDGFSNNIIEIDNTGDKLFHLIRII